MCVYHLASKRRHLARLVVPLTAAAWVLSTHVSSPAGDKDSSVFRKLSIVGPGQPQRLLDFDEVVLHVPSAGVALIADGRIAWSRSFGVNAAKGPVYQAASMSKFVAAIVAMRLVEEGVLSLEAPVDDKLKM